MANDEQAFGWVYTLPFEVIMSATYERRSSIPQSPNFQFTGGTTITTIALNTAPLGAISLPASNIWDMRFAKRFRLMAGHSVEARFDFFNIFNANFTTSQTTRQSPTYLVPTAIIQPRVLQMGVTYKF